MVRPPVGILPPPQHRVTCASTHVTKRDASTSLLGSRIVRSPSNPAARSGSRRSTSRDMRFIACRKRSASPPWVMLLMQALEPFLGHQRVDLRGRQRAVAKQHLQGAQVGAVVEQMRGEAVA